jgi:hypothetical protein
VIDHEQKQRRNDNFDEECKKTVEEKNRAEVKVVQRETRLNGINSKGKRVEPRRFSGERGDIIEREFSIIGRTKYESLGKITESTRTGIQPRTSCGR